MKSFHVLLAVGLLALGVGSAVAERTLTVDDILGLRQLREVRLSPDGSQVAFVVDVSRRRSSARVSRTGTA